MRLESEEPKSKDAAASRFPPPLPSWERVGERGKEERLPCLSQDEHKARRSIEPRHRTDGGGTPLVEGGGAARRHDRPVVHPILPHRRYPRDARVARVREPAGRVRRVPGRPPQCARDVRPVHAPQRIGHRTGPYPSGPRPARMDRFLAATGNRTLRGRPRPSVVRRRPGQGARRCLFWTITCVAAIRWSVGASGKRAPNWSGSAACSLPAPSRGRRPPRPACSASKNCPTGTWPRYAHPPHCSGRSRTPPPA